LLLTTHYQITRILPNCAVLALIIGNLVLSGCISGSSSPASLEQSASEVQPNTDMSRTRTEMIAADLVSALRQLQGLDPLSIRVSVNSKRSSHAEVLTKELMRVGYDLTESSSPEQAELLTYAIKSVVEADGSVYEFTLSIRDIRLSRQYRLRDEKVEPASSFLVLGMSADTIDMDATLFGDDDTMPRDNIELFELVAEAKKAPHAPKVPSRPTLLKNMFETGESNYGEFLQNYSDVRQIVLVFANDSVVMGSKNKKLVRDLINEQQEATDVFSVIGCSHGKTAVEGKNRGLALGRSLRVREELILSGINPARVLEEGCWDSQHSVDKMPHRGVVLTLKRLQPSS